MSANTKRNLIYIVLDDMGFSDLGCFGAEIATPNLDALAADGIVYNNFTVCPASSPTRASLLTGRDSSRVGMGSISNMVLGPDRPDVQGRIRDDAGTIAQILQKNGFATYCVGKWHVAPTFHANAAGPYEYWPLRKGFDRFYGFMEGDCDQYCPYLIYDHHYIDAPTNPQYHLSEDLVDRSIEFIDDGVSVYPEKPFFLYLAFGVAHSPHQVMKPYIDRYDGVYDEGWDVIRRHRYERQLELGIIPEGTILTPKEPDIRDWDTLSNEERQVFTRFEQTYAGFITHCDEQIGRLIAHLKEIGEYDNSLIFVLSDNGATRDGGPEGMEEFLRFLNGRSLPFTRLYERIDEIGTIEMKALYPKGWANVSNTPFREYKGTNYGGAVRTPLIVHTAEGTAGASGICRTFCNVQDITPTALSALGITPPERIDGMKQIPMQGTDFSATFSNLSAAGGSTTKFYRWANARAIYDNGWKALSLHMPGTLFEEDRWELYHLSEDFSESNDFSAQYPEKLNAMKKLWEREAIGSTPLPMVEINAGIQCTPEGSPALKQHFRFVGNPRYWGSGSDPITENRPHIIRAKIRRESAADEGVLLAAGGITGGWTFYIKGNRLCYCMNNFMEYFSGQTAPVLPSGECEVSFRYESEAYCKGTGYLTVDGADLVSFYMETTPQLLNGEGMSMGRDAYTPVTPDYDGEFPFSGTIHEITIDIDSVLHPVNPDTIGLDDHPAI